MSIGLAVALSALTALALAILLAPLFLRRRGPAAREAYNLAVYRDQLAEVERDLARGVLATEHAEAARVEIARRILALKPAEAGADPNPAGPMGSRAALTVAILLLGGVALARFYRRTEERAAPPLSAEERRRLAAMLDEGSKG